MNCIVFQVCYFQRSVLYGAIFDENLTKFSLNSSKIKKLWILVCMLFIRPFNLSYRSHTISHGIQGPSPYSCAYLVFEDIYPPLARSIFLSFSCWALNEKWIPYVGNPNNLCLTLTNPFFPQIKNKK